MDGAPRAWEHPDLSVILACDGAVSMIADRLEAIARACAGYSAEVLVVHDAGTPVVISANPPIPVTRVQCASDLVPVLWGQGIAAAKGRVVALTTTQFRVREGWARTFLDEIAAGATGVGGRMAIPSGASMLERAVFLIRYSEHMSETVANGPRDIAGDNAAYRRDAVLEACPNVAAGFWEVDAHRIMRAHGARFSYAPGAVAEFNPTLSFREMVANRFVHGAHYGAYRVRALGWPRWRAVAVTPLVPVVLLARIVGRVRRAGRPVGVIVALFPSIMLLLIAWAAGEARGALRGDGPVT